MGLVLVIDDDPVAVRQVLSILEEDGALDGRGASTIAEARDHVSEADVAIVGMRTGIGGGVAMLAELTTLEPLLEGLIMTSAADADATADALAAVGPLRHVARPTTADELLPRLHAAIDRRKLRAHVRDLEGQLAHQGRSLDTATERLVQAEQLAAVGRVVTGIAHELMQQLALVGYAEAIKSRVAHDPELVELAEVIVRAQKRLASMVDEIRDFASAPRTDDEPAPRLTVQPADLAAAVDEALALIGFDRDVRRRKLVRRWTARPIVALHHDKFIQVVINLVSNAALATRPGDEVTIELGVDGGKAKLDVVDRGVGMSPEVLARLGEPFFTTRGDRGSGLGVGICMRIVEEHGGTLTFHSQVGAGTTATVCLPLLEAPR